MSCGCVVCKGSIGAMVELNWQRDVEVSRQFLVPLPFLPQQTDVLKCTAGATGGEKPTAYAKHSHRYRASHSRRVSL